MTTQPSVSAPAGDSPPVHRYATPGEAVVSIATYTRSLESQAVERRAHGLSVSDQDHPEAGFCLQPAEAGGRPLALIGGMGPLAGALAFRSACESFGATRPIVLYQACSVPDRTPAILADQDDPTAPVALDMVACLVRAIARTVELLPRATPRVDCIIACNSAHYFWAQLNHTLACAPDFARRVNLISTVESGVRAVRAQACQRSLLLCTQGARAGRIFARAADQLGIRFAEPEPALDRLLMRAIYDGIKSLDDARAVEFGTQFFEGVLRDMGEFDGVVAGCTELPPVIELLRRRSTPAVRTFLGRATVIDPMAAALDASAGGRWSWQIPLRQRAGGFSLDWTQSGIPQPALAFRGAAD